MVWVKGRNRDYGSGAGDQWQLADVLRGQYEVLISATTSVEQNVTTAYGGGGIGTLGTENYTIVAGLSNSDNYNANTYTYAGWAWKAGGTPTADNSAGAGATPTAGSVKINGSNLGSALAGSIAATRLSADTTNGFSIVKYAGNSTSGATVAHGLSQAPELIIVKCIDVAEAWAVYSSALSSNNKYLVLDTDAGEASDTGRWNDTTPTASVFSLGNASEVNSTNDYIAYCLHSVEGYSKVGSYEGNGDADGSFIYTGFRPALVIIKNIDTSADWILVDNKRDGYNVDNNLIFPNDDNIESTSDYMDILSNGFKFRSSATSVNASNDYMYYAVAAYPFKYANAR